MLGHIGTFFNGIFGQLQRLISTPAFPRVAPQIGWLGVVAIFGWIAWAIAGLRSMLLVVATLLMFGIWGALAGQRRPAARHLHRRRRLLRDRPAGRHRDGARNAVSAAVTPVLDLMQTMPPFAYLAPVALLFGIGPDHRASC